MKRDTETILGADLQRGDVIPTANYGDVIVDHLRYHVDTAKGDWVQWYGVGDGATRKLVIAPIQRKNEPITILRRAN